MTVIVSAQYSAGGVDGGARDENDRVARHDEAKQDGRLEHDEQPGERGAQHGVDALHQVEDRIEQLVHAASLATAPDGAPDSGPSARVPSAPRS